jgi:chemotaxis family two-component system response regulator PixH
MKQQSVLIVEDDEWLAEQFARALNKENYQTAIALHTLSAIEMIDKVNPDVIVLDLLLTGNTAFSFMHEMQTYDDTSKIPVIICSNLASELTLETLKPYGVKRILDKALMKPMDLVAAVKSVLL